VIQYITFQKTNMPSLKDGPGIGPFINATARTGLGVVGGTLLSTILSTLFGIGSTVAQNQYNSPAAQLKRLRKAGLPLSYMYQGRVNQQSQAPQMSIDPSLGQVQKIGLHQQDEINKKNIQRIHQQIAASKETTRGKWLENQSKAGELSWQNEVKNYKGADGVIIPRTNQERSFDLKMATAKANKFILENTGSIKAIALDIARATKITDIAIRRKELEKIGAAIKNLAAQNKLMVQLHGIRGIDEQVNETISKMLENTGDGGTLFYTLIAKLFSKL